MELHRDDIVMHVSTGSAGVILDCILTDCGRLLLKMEVLRRVGARASVWAQTPLQEVWNAADAYHPVAWRKRDDGHLVIIV